MVNMPTRNINLTGHYDAFVDELVTSGRFSSASEVIRAGLRLLEQQSCEDEEKLTLLRSLAAEGFNELDHGRGIVIDGQKQIAELISAAGKRAAEAVELGAANG
jgi:antitoxin ParD1/3/4